MQPPHPRRLHEARRPPSARWSRSPGRTRCCSSAPTRAAYAVRRDHVVGVGEPHVVAPDVPQSLVAGRAQAPVVDVHDPDPGVAGGVLLRDVAGVVRRAVVDDDHVELLVRLGEDRVEAGGEVVGHVVDRDHDPERRVGTAPPTEDHGPTVVTDSLATREQPGRRTCRRGSADRQRGVPPQGAVRRGSGPQRHQHHGGPDAHPRPARAAARGRRRRDQPQGVRRAALGGRPPRPAAQGGAGPGQRRPPRGLVRDRPGLHARARADPDGRVAGGPLRGQPRAGRQGPAAELVHRPVAGGRDPHRRHAGLRDDAAPACRGGRQQADLLRQQARVGAPGRVLAQHAAAHRAGDPGVGGRRRPGVRPLRRPARRLGQDDDARGGDPPAPARPALRQRADPRRPPLRRPRAAPDAADPGGPRAAAAAARPHRRHLGGAQQARRPRWRHPGGARGPRRAAGGLRRPLRGVRRDLPLVGRRRRAAHQAPGQARPAGAPRNAAVPTCSRTRSGPRCRRRCGAGCAVPSAANAR